ncbi:MAG: nucleotidyltransferase [Saprospirales bacterium]|nr:nucleotidyltransferase [Saprospirales bacterium]
MFLEKKLQYSDILEKLAEVLDITPSQYKAAVERYEAVGRWLSKEDSPLAQFNPVIYPQGSFRLGTVIKPITGEDEFDIDLVCLLETNCKDHTQEEVKGMVGDRLKENDTYKKMLDEEGRRCWTLIYAESTKFHMDILPSIPDECNWLIQQGVPFAFAENAISITDNKAPNYRYKSEYWAKSNPKGYAEWFKEQMKVILNERKQTFSEKHQMSIEQVQDYEVKTPLQRAIQLLKRHRDLMFKDDENRPISIIITTLAARSYANESNIYDALVGILDRMPNYIETKEINGKQVKWVVNPVNPLENFADKWEYEQQKEKNFYKWLAQAKKDILEAINEIGLDKIAERLKAPFGERAVNEAMNRFGNSLRETRESGKLFMASGTGMLGNEGKTKVQNHTFYGSKE